MWAERFWSKVTRGDGCWLWAAGCFRNGYGSFCVNGRDRGAHRAAWELTNGPVPEGLCVLHRCDTPACVRPDHLFLGTDADNMRDKASKGRAARVFGDRNGARTHPELRPRGDGNGASRTTSAAVARLRDVARQSGRSQRSLAAEFGLSQSQVGRILRGLNWRPDVAA